MTWKGDVQAPGRWDGGNLPSLGIKGSDIPNSGVSGASFFYAHYTPGAEDDVEFYAEFISVPNGTRIRFSVDEYGIIVLQAPDGSYQAQYNLYKAGTLDPGSPYLLTFNIGV